MPGWRNGRRARFRTLCPQGRGGSTPLPGTKRDRRGRRWPRPPSRPAPQRPRTGKIRAGKSKEVREKARKFTFLIKKGARYRSQKNKTKITKIP